MLAMRLRAVMRSAVAIVASDSFTRADNALSLGSATTGQLWTASVWGISANKAAMVSGNGFATLDTATANLTVTNVVATISASNPGIVFRYADATNWARVIIINQSVRIDWMVAGVETDSATFPATIADGITLKAVIFGTALSVSVNGTQVATKTLPAGLTGKRAGLFSNSAAARFGAFTVTTP